MNTDRIIIIGGPQCGKSTYALSLNKPVFCGDPRSLVKRPVDGVTYLPEHLSWSAGSDFIANNWFKQKGPYVIEGVSIVRALRKWKKNHSVVRSMPCDRIIYIVNKHPSVQRLPGQDAMEKAVLTVWNEIRNYYAPITNYKAW
jgi:hypothetical protein